MKRFIGVSGFVVFCFGFIGCALMPASVDPALQPPAIATEKEGESVIFSTNTNGTLKLINDTRTVEFFSIYFDGKSIRVNDGATIIHPSQTITASSDKNTSYVVYGSSYSNVLWTGTLSGGTTIELRFSTLR